MSINYDNSADVSGTGTTTNSYTVTGLNPVLIVFASILDGDFFNGVPTYNGVNLTQIDKFTDSASTGNGDWYLLNPPTGSHTLVIPITGSHVVKAKVISYTGVRQTSFPDNHTTNSTTSTTMTTSLTTVADNCWTVLAGGSQRAPTASTNTTQRINTLNQIVGDSNGDIHPAGSFSMTCTQVDSTQASWMMISMAPVLTALVSASDTTAITESIKLVITNIAKTSDTTNISENVTVKIFNLVIGDFNATLTTSNYKWETSTLLTAQQKYAVRPYFKAAILDDTIQPNQIINNLGTEQPILGGSAVTAPDSCILAVGFDNSNGISFFKAANLHTSNGVWDSTTQFEASSSSILGGNSQRVIVSCSDWISGSYHIDVFYFKNFGNDGTNMQVIQQYSDNGGTTWASRTWTLSSILNTNYGGANPKNLSLCAFKPRLVSGVVNSGFAFIRPNGNVFASGFQSYDIVYRLWNGVEENLTVWTTKNANSNDWTIHSLDSFYLNGRDYIVFAGFRNFIDSANVVGNTPATFSSGNYSLWITSFIEQTDTTTSDVMSKPIQIFSSNSTNAINQNSFTYPVATVTNGTVNILFRAITVASVSQSAQGSTSQVVTTNINYMLTNTIDGINFTYPSIVVFSDGTVFNDSNLSNAQNYNSYTNQGQYYYILGSGKLWEFIQNNTLADITNSVVQYSIQDTAGQPSSITLQLANQNNQWYPNGTNSGASAISKNKKILLQQGYYNANGVSETVPRNIYYIDDITQSTSSNSNDVTLSGRDLYKKLKTTVTKYAYGWLGPYLYTDIFDGSTLANWSQISGTWSEATYPNTLSCLSTSSDSVITLNSLPTLSYGSFMCVNLQRNVTVGTQYIYAFYLDSNNWLRLEMTDSAWTIRKSIAGVQTSLDTNTFTMSSNISYTLYVRRYDYYKFNFMIGNGASTNTPPFPNPITISSNVVLFEGSNQPTGEYDLTSSVIGLTSEPWSIGLGMNGVTTPIGFQFFKYAQYDNSSNINELLKALATKAGVNSYNIQNTIKDDFNDTTPYTGTFTHPNNTLAISAGHKAINTVVGNEISNGEISFKAKVIPTNSANPYGFKLVFRSDNNANEYYWHVLTTATGGYQSSHFERLYSSTDYVFPAQVSDVISNPPATLTGNGNFDLTQTHTYKVVLVDGWMIAYIDGIMVNAWNDNNTTVMYLTTGFWGWSADTNSTLTVYNMTSTSFWKQVQQFSLNPGDDIESAILSLIQTIRGWVFSNLMGTLKAIFLNSTDTSTYTYQNQIYAQGVDSSDKEYVSQVTVYGNNVSAIAQNTTLMAGAAVREEVIVDYSILTQEDAQTRANYELTNANQYQAQYNPKQTMNVGAELFDAVTVVDTGNNTSGVNSITRVYAQKLTTGGNNNEYSVEIDTGTI